jgi:Ohr subfamily peroxiredoxin
MTIAVAYTAEGTAWGGREGRVASADGRIDIQLSVPKELGGPGGPGSNPEELFAVGYAACFHSALKLVASQRHIDVADSAVTVRVGIGADDADGGFGLTVEILGEIPGVDDDTARGLLEQAHAVCPYSKATRNNIVATVDLVGS